MHADRAKYEVQLGRARQALTLANNLAVNMGDEGASEDLTQMVIHMTTLMTESMSQKPGRRKRLVLEQRQTTIDEMLQASTISGEPRTPSWRDG